MQIDKVTYIGNIMECTVLTISKKGDWTNLVLQRLTEKCVHICNDIKYLYIIVMYFKFI